MAEVAFDINRQRNGGIAYQWKEDGRGSYGQSVSRTHADLIDMNGDGLPDLVWTDNDGNIHVRYNQMGKRHLLRTVTNPTGQQFHLHYTLSEPDTEQRSRQWLLTQVDDVIAHTDALSCDTITRRFAYADPHYDAAERTPLGYGVVETHDINTMEQPHSLYRRHIRHYQNADFVEHGKLLYDALTDAQGNRYTEYKLDILYHDSAGVTDNLCQDITIRVGKESHITTYFEGGQDSIVTAKQYDYDRYHNVVTYRNLGDANIGDDDLMATITYRDATSGSNLVHNLVSLPTGVTISANQTKVRKDTATYDGKGSLIKYKQTDLATGSARTTDYSYNDYGRVETILLPENDNGQRASYTIEYDSYSQSLPARVTNQWGLTTSTTYHRYWQLPTTVTDVAGNSIRYTYDNYCGRLTSVVAPKEYIDNEKTITYTYFPKKLASSPASISYADVRMYSYGDSMVHRTFVDARGDNVQRLDLRNGDYVVSGCTARDCFGRITTTYANMWGGDLLDSLYSGYYVPITHTAYDILDRPVSTLWADSTENATSYGIDADAFNHKRLLQIRTDENGNEWQQYTSPQGWLTTSVAPDEATTTFRYDPLGQLLQSTDPDGLTTTHTYDCFGRRTQRTHPDAGTTRWTYDAAGNMIASATQVQLNRGEQTTYEYDYTRPTHIHYPRYPQNDVYYTYDSVGRISMVQDATGTERMEYDAMGNVSLSERTIVIPTELTAYRFITQFSYDAFGRVQQITYPDGEIVSYNYSNGLLSSIDGDDSVLYIQSIDYDEYDAPIHIQYGNGLTSDIAYDDVRRWIVARSLRDENNDYLQDISYHYDNVGNITQIEQDAPPYDNMGGEYMVTYTYDNQYRLIDAAQRNSSIRGDYDYTMAYSPSGVVDTKYCPETGTDITFGYTQGYNNSAFYTHQPQMAYSSTEEDIVMFRWDWNGQLTHIGRPYTEQFRRHVWNEAGQLTAVFGNEYCGYYAYDAQGNRAYKITGSVVEDQHNAGYPSYTAYFDDATLYVNPYMVVTPQGYTKHYYNGSQRIASRLGDYWELEDPSVDAEDELATADSLWLHTTTIIEPDHQDMEGDYQYIQADGSNLPIVSYGPYISSIQGLHGEDMLWTVFGGHSHEDDGGMTDDGVFYYHPDHLGSATWITSDRGQVVQYIHYMPFGELWENQQASAYNERFKFTGKERDAETGYDYFGARYYLSLLGIWLSPDPLLDESPNISSYAFCGWNPIKNVDPDGRDWVYQEDGSKYMWRDDITESSDMPKGLQYVGAQANDILYHMGLSSQYETQSSTRFSIGCVGGGNVPVGPLGQGILGAGEMQLEATIGISANCAMVSSNVSENNRSGLTFTGITVFASGIVSSTTSSPDLQSSIYGVLDVYTNKQTFSKGFSAPSGQYVYSSGTTPRSAEINIPASAISNGTYIQSAKLSIGSPNSAIIHSTTSKLQWNLQRRALFR